MKRFSLLLLLLMASSTVLVAQKRKKDANPPAAGFNLAGSDEKAIELADQVMKAMGGREAWDNTKVITWNFFGARKLTWNKWTGDVRIEGLRDNSITLVNLNTKKGRVRRNGTEVTQPDSVKKYVDRGISAWINDSYWVFMPFKLKDSGVTLKYLGEEKTDNGILADVLRLTFQNVGDTPQNGYKVWVDKDKKLVAQWAYFAKADQEKPNFVNPWNDYQKQGELLLSGDRGQRKITEIGVLTDVPERIFKEF